MRLQKRAVSQAVRRKEGVQEFYYPKEWFAQKESTQMTMYRGTEEWKEKAQQPLGSELSMDERRNMFWRMEKAMTDVEEYKKGVGMFFLPFLDWSIKDGCKPFLSPAHAHKLYSNIHQRHVDELVRFTAGSPEEAAPLDALISTTSFDATQASIHFHACMHWNMLFFWKSIVPFGSVDVPVRTRQAIWKYFNDDGLKQLEKEFISAGMDMVGNGFVWLVWNPALQVLQVRTTERHQCPKVLDLYPLLCCNVWDNAITPGYELNKLEYLRRFWLCVDWTWVDKCYGWLSTEIQVC